MKKAAITKIEEHLYENKNGTVRTVYRVFGFDDIRVYEEKSKSQLTKTEKEWMNKNGIAMVFHF